MPATFKNAASVLIRRIDFDFHTALYRVDDRREYGETRIRAMGTLDGRLHALVFVEQATGIRVISFRKANCREIKRYESSRPSSVFPTSG
jgi:uncharacterized DUF497 family protein